jgi:hypothetical protein
MAPGWQRLRVYAARDRRDGRFIQFGNRDCRHRSLIGFR